ncbi:MAG: hypothetical protein R2745_14180 [Vicinamibacterales bacterium]
MSGARARCGLVPAAALLLASCAAPAPRPAGPSSDDPGAVAALLSATPHCRPLKTATTEIRLSGRVGTERVRARLLAGFAEPSSVRLEALAPFGPPGLILASDGVTDTLLFPREHQVLRGAPVADVLDALTGLPLDAAELRDVLLGCLAGPAGRGLRYGDAWQEVVDGEAHVFLRRGVVVGASYRGWQVDYAAHLGGIARRVRVRRQPSTPPIDLVAELSGVETNVPLDAAAFEVAVPLDATPIGLDDLRRASPLSAR